ncbi:uncharacterized protein LOC126835953, partial [Adelges cooleyi]|uniref:uncharacterized protein LOC126835953 n=1 Tax=Adelges cooleyi TaxID=133065 RepID=UPI00217F55A6
GPVFIIKELDKDKSEYEAFVTNGGIQEVRSAMGPQAQQQQQQQPPQSGAPGSPSSFVKDTEEDTEYFAVLITPETVAQLQFAKSAQIQVPVSVLLVAVSSKLPWLMVLRRKSYPQFFEYQQQQQLPAGVLPQPGGGGPLQRRRFYDRHRRGLLFGQQQDEDEMTRLVPLIFEGEMLSTMCYNFIQDYVTAGKLPRVPVSVAAKTDLGQQQSEQRAAESYAVVEPTSSAVPAPSSADTLPVQMAVPKRVA